MLLPPDANEQIAALPDVACLEAEYSRLAQCLKEKYGKIRDAPDSEGMLSKYVEVRRICRARKQYYRSQMLSQQREEFFVRKDTELIESQLNIDDKCRAVRPKRKAPSLSIPERLDLVKLSGAGDLRSPSLQAQRAAAVQAMADLCCRMEISRIPVKASNAQRSCTPPQPTSADRRESIPMRCDSLQCLFCVGDKRLALRDRTRTFNRLQALWKHAKNHLDTIDVLSEVRCPHPICSANGCRLESIEHLLNHAEREHGVRLRSR